MLYLTCAFIGCYLAAGVVFGFRWANKLFLDIRLDPDSFGVTIGPAVILYVIGLIAYSC